MTKRKLAYGVKSNGAAYPKRKAYNYGGTHYPSRKTNSYEAYNKQSQKFSDEHCRPLGFRCTMLRKGAKNMDGQLADYTLAQRKKMAADLEVATRPLISVDDAPDGYRTLTQMSSAPYAHNIHNARFGMEIAERIEKRDNEKQQTFLINQASKNYRKRYKTYVNAKPADKIKKFPALKLKFEALRTLSGERDQMKIARWAKQITKKPKVAASIIERSTAGLVKLPGNIQLPNAPVVRSRRR